MGLENFKSEDPNLVVENGVLRVGPKKRHVEIPNGWDVVTSGECKRGDKYLYAGDLYMSINWRLCEEEDFGMPYDSFGVLIREFGRTK